MGNEKIRLIYLIGSGRSGSTVVASTLARNTRSCNLGEVYNFAYFFSTARQFERYCECGERLLDCEYWQDIGAHLSVGAADELTALKSKSEKEFHRANRDLLGAIHKVSRAPAYIDSSKRIYRLRLLRTMSDIDLTSLHIVRDPRAYGYSSKLTEMKKGAGPSVYYKKVFRWILKNLAIMLIGIFSSQHRLVRYEDFVSDPKTQLATIHRLVGIDQVEADHDCQASHQFSGNSGVFKQGPIELKHDRRFLEGLSATEWWLSTILCMPLLLLMRYPLRRSGYAK